MSQNNEFHKCLANMVYKPDGSIPDPSNELLKFRCNYRAMVAASLSGSDKKVTSPRVFSPLNSSEEFHSVSSTASSSTSSSSSGTNQCLRIFSLLRRSN